MLLVTRLTLIRGSRKKNHSEIYGIKRLKFKRKLVVSFFRFDFWLDRNRCVNFDQVTHASDALPVDFLPRWLIVIGEGIDRNNFSITDCLVVGNLFYNILILIDAWSPFFVLDEFYSLIAFFQVFVWMQILKKNIISKSLSRIYRLKDRIIFPRNVSAETSPRYLPLSNETLSLHHRPIKSPKNSKHLMITSRSMIFASHEKIAIGTVPISLEFFVGNFRDATTFTRKICWRKILFHALLKENQFTLHLRP